VVDLRLVPPPVEPSPTLPMPRGRLQDSLDAAHAGVRAVHAARDHVDDLGEMALKDGDASEVWIKTSLELKRAAVNLAEILSCLQGVARGAGMLEEVG
jgi:hypothetical protein